MPLYSRARELAKALASTGQMPLNIAETLGMSVLFLPFQTIAGAAVSAGKERFILINSGLHWLEQQFVCGHEIGHFVLHPSTNFMLVHRNFYGSHEYEASMFSCYLMLGDRVERYKLPIHEVCVNGRLDRIVGLLALVLGDELWTP